MKWIWAVVVMVALFASRTPAAEVDDFGVDEVDEADGIDQQLEDLWAAEIIERAADRTSDEMSALDLMVTGLLAVQAAIYAILIDKEGEFGWPIPTMFIVAIVLAAVNLFVLRARKVPNPEVFHDAALRDTQQARKDLIDALLIATKKNESRLWWKRLFFWLALALTVLAAMLAPSQAHRHDVAPPLYRVVEWES
jgi:MFS family permease